MRLFGDRPAASWVSEYEESHRHPVNRACHAIGIPMIVLSLVFLAGGFLMRPLWFLGSALFVAGWSLQFVGHAFEGRPPEFLKDWRFLLVGTRWWWMTVSTRGRKDRSSLR
jgi:uncharacterized membrane protein YGL010W